MNPNFNQKRTLYYTLTLATPLIGALAWALCTLSSLEVLAEFVAVNATVMTLGFFFTWHGYLYDQDADKFILGYTAMILAIVVGLWFLVKIYDGDINIYHNFIVDFINKVICHFTCPR